MLLKGAFIMIHAYNHQNEGFMLRWNFWSGI